MGAAACLLVLLAGAAVGATSIGGVLVVPALTGWAGVGIEPAIAASSFGFACTGAAAFSTRRRVGSAPVAAAGWPLHAGALLGAALGALTLAALPAGAVRVGVGLLAVASGLHSIVAGRGPTVERDPPTLGPAPLAALGAVVGCASAWSGTGGPVVLLPLLSALGWSAERAVDAAQRIQLPVALAATAVNLSAGRLDLRLGVAVGGLLLAGWAAGRWAARRLPTSRLRSAVAWALVGVGLIYLIGPYLA